MTPDARVHLDRRIAEERMTELQPHFEVPDGISLGDGLYAFAMDAEGRLSRRVPIDEVDWRSTTAIRLETAWGQPVDSNQIVDDDWDHE